MPHAMPSSSFLGQQRSSNLPGSQLLLRSLISGWQFKFIWVFWSSSWQVLDEGWCLPSQGWITTSSLLWQDLLSGDSLLLPCVSIQFTNWNSWILAFLALINSLIMYQNLAANKVPTVEHFDFPLSIVRDLLQAGSSSTKKSFSHIPASKKITWPAPTTHSAMPLLPTQIVSKYTPILLCQIVPGMYSPLWMERIVSFTRGEEVMVVVVVEQTWKPA